MLECNSYRMNCLYLEKPLYFIPISFFAILPLPEVIKIGKWHFSLLGIDHLRCLCSFHTLKFLPGAVFTQCE